MMIDEPRLRLVSILLESKRQAKQKYVDTGLMTEEEFDQLLEKDPTGRKKYILWMCKQYVEKDKTFEHYDVIADFDELVQVNKIENTDIYFYKTLEEVTAEVERAKKVITKSEAKRGLRDFGEVPKEHIRFQNEFVIVLEPTTHAQAQKWGKGTPWCIAIINPQRDYWKEYTQDNSARIYYVFPLQPSITADKYERMAWVVYPRNRYEMWDKTNSRMSKEEVMTVFGDTFKIPLPPEYEMKDTEDE
jgi:hypothetical protein